MGQTAERKPCEDCQQIGKDKSGINKVLFYDNHNELWEKCMRDNCTGNKARLVNGDPSNIITATTYYSDDSISINYDAEPDLTNRGLTLETAIKLNIQTGTYNDQEAHFYHYSNKDNTVDTQVRILKDKQFRWVPGKSQTTRLFNIQNCNDFTKPLVIVEGVLDCATFVQLGYQACSFINAGSETKQIEQDLDLINKFPEIWIAPDKDDGAGEETKQNILKILAHKKIKVIDMSPRKDANDYIREDSASTPDVAELYQCIKSKQEVLPEGLVPGTKLDFTRLRETNIRSIKLPWPALQECMQGLEYGCFYLLLAGTGCGKSTLLRELVYFYRQEYPELRIANFFFEENDRVTPLSYMALHLNIPLGQLRREIVNISDLAFNEAKQIVNSDNLFFINSKFDKTIDNVLKQIEYLVTVQGVDLIIIDHISYVIGRSGVSKHGERRDIDEFIYKLQDLTQRLGCIVVAVSHINESSSQKRWDQGEVPNIYSGRGSKALAQIPDGIIGLARDMTNNLTNDVSSIYNLKNRWFSNLGKCDTFDFINKTGRMVVRK